MPTFDQLKEFFLYLGAALGALTAIFTAVTSLRGQKPKMLVDDSIAAGNFQDVIIKMQANQIESDARYAELEAKVDGKQLRVHMTIEIDKPPQLDSYEWVNRNDIPTRKIPHKTNGGLWPKL